MPNYFANNTTFVPLPSDPRNEGIEPTKDGGSIPGYWAEVKDELSFGDVNYRNGEVVQIGGKGFSDPDGADAKWMIARFGQATLERAIVRWNLDQDGNPLPLSPKTIERLRNQDAQAILAEVTRNDRGQQEGKASASERISKPSTDEPELSLSPPGSEPFANFSTATPSPSSDSLPA